MDPTHAPDSPAPVPVAAPVPAADEVSFEMQAVRYSLPVMLRELQLERTQSFFAKEIIDQVEISKIFAQAKKERAKRNK